MLGVAEIGIQAEIWDIDTRSIHFLKFKRSSGLKTLYKLKKRLKARG